MNKFLIVVVGPTAVGKTDFCVRLAEDLGCEVVSADSRQFFLEMSIGTAKPEAKELKGIPHHFVNFLSVEDEISAGGFETLALEKFKEIFSRSDLVIITGGSGLYIKAVCEGMSEMPAAPLEIRNELMEQLESEGLERLLMELKDKDPFYFENVDKNNYQRVVRALEMIRFTGKPFSQFRTGEAAKRDFSIIKIGLEMDREQLYERINLRVDRMLQTGLLEEVKSLYPKRHLNALQTVGYSEFFEFMEGKHDLDEAIRLVKRNTRRYAKRQMTWFKKDPDIHWFEPGQYDEVLKFVKHKTDNLK